MIVFFLPKFIRQVAKENTRECDPGHGGIVKRACDGHAEVKLFDDFRNDDANRICRHREHHEHKEGEPLDDGQILFDPPHHSSSGFL